MSWNMPWDKPLSRRCFSDEWPYLNKRVMTLEAFKNVNCKQKKKSPGLLNAHLLQRLTNSSWGTQATDVQYSWYELKTEGLSDCDHSGKRVSLLGWVNWEFWWADRGLMFHWAANARTFPSFVRCSTKHNWECSEEKSAPAAQTLNWT